MSSPRTGTSWTVALRDAVEVDHAFSRWRRFVSFVAFPALLVPALTGSAAHPGVAAAWIGSVLAGLGWLGLASSVTRPVWVLPAAAVLLACGGLVLLAGSGNWTSASGFCLVAAYLAGYRLTLRRALVLDALIAVGMVVVLGPYGSLTDPAVIVLAVGGTLLIGIIRRDAARRNEERERSLVADARARAEYARAETIAERARIARDVHDVLAHSLSALAVQLQGARLMARRDGAAEDTVAQIERAQQLATEGLAEARRAVRALRAGPEAPVDVADGLRTLLADHPGATAEIDACSLDARAGEAVLRTAQEALSNVRKHAPGAAVHVRLRRVGAGTELEVTDVAGSPPPAADGSGYGLVGMTERAELVGATVDAGPTADGWRVRLRIPAGAGEEGS